MVYFPVADSQVSHDTSLSHLSLDTLKLSELSGEKRDFKEYSEYGIIPLKRNNIGKFARGWISVIQTQSFKRHNKTVENIPITEDVIFKIIIGLFREFVW